jgi:hypothetical protein
MANSNDENVAVGIYGRSPYPHLPSLKITNIYGAHTFFSLRTVTYFRPICMYFYRCTVLFSAPLSFSSFLFRISPCIAVSF